jgi:hypothetical protein
MPETSEQEIQNQIILALSQGNSRLFRNNVGGAKLADGRWLNFGLHKGSSDLIGWKTIEITPDMVGKKIAQFLSVEVKKPKGRVSKDQQNWIDAVNAQGGCAFIARSKEDAVNATI